MVLGRVAVEVARYGANVVSRNLFKVHKLDVRIHKSLYGSSGGRGVRHGRDAGIFISQYFEGDDLDEHAVSPPVGPGFQASSRKFSKAYRGNKRYRNRCPPKRYRRY